MLVDEFTEWREIPHEPGNEFCFRPLSGPERTEAEQKQQKRSLALFEGLTLQKEMLEVIREVQKDRQRQQVEAAKAAVDEALDKAFEPARPEDRFDPQTTVKYGLVDWRGPAYPKACGDQTKKQLDAATWEWAHEQVVSLSVRPPGEGNGSGTNSDRDSSPETSLAPSGSGVSE